MTLENKTKGLLVFNQKEVLIPRSLLRGVSLRVETVCLLSLKYLLLMIGNIEKG
jgi:hypothetical protein